jgi:hypothetical protein
LHLSGGFSGAAENRKQDSSEDSNDGNGTIISIKVKAFFLVDMCVAPKAEFQEALRNGWAGNIN